MFMLMLIVMAYARAPMIHISELARDVILPMFWRYYLLYVVVDKKEDLYTLVLLMLVLIILIGIYFDIDIYDDFNVDVDV